MASTQYLLEGIQRENPSQSPTHSLMPQFYKKPAEGQEMQEADTFADVEKGGFQVSGRAS